MAGRRAQLMWTQPQREQDSRGWVMCVWTPRGHSPDMNRTLRGWAMTCVWTWCGQAMMCVWTPNGHSPDVNRTLRGQAMMYVWTWRGRAMMCVWTLRGQAMMCVWTWRGRAMMCVWTLAWTGDDVRVDPAWTGNDVRVDPAWTQPRREWIWFRRDRAGTGSRGRHNVAGTPGVVLRKWKKSQGRKEGAEASPRAEPGGSVAWECWPEASMPRQRDGHVDV
ncbi:polycomb group RING finger protein 3 isoform X3 [Macaca fascicularis]|uniref:polycomb group RING finger protein 3 isoform X3 n=1 Tax=Macaca fascicularis TaxID=9541 RepID=UPI0032B0278F